MFIALIFLLMFIIPVGCSYIMNIYSAPSSIVIDKNGQIIGSRNELKESLQGKKFWASQKKLVEKELKAAMDAPNQEAEEYREYLKNIAESRRETNKYYQEYPELRPSAAELNAENLRQEADDIEYREMLRTFASERKKRLEELKMMQQFLETKP